MSEFATPAAVRFSKSHAASHELLAASADDLSTMPAKLTTLAFTVTAAITAAAKRKNFFIMFLFLELIFELIVKSIFKSAAKVLLVFDISNNYLLKNVDFLTFLI